MVLTITGSNGFERSHALKQLTQAFIKEHGDMGLEIIDGEESAYERLYEALTSLPFLVLKKLIVLNRPGANKKFTESLEQLLPEIADTTDVIINEPKLDKRLSYYKLLKKKTDFREYNELDANGLARWLVKTAKEQGASLSQTDAGFLVQRVGANQQLLASELEKLSIYEPAISRSTIELLTEPNPQSTIFELIEAAFAGNQKRLLQLYAEQRVQKVEPPQIVAMLTWQLHVLALVKTAGQRSAADIAKAAKLNPYVVQRSVIAARNISGQHLKDLIHRLLELDVLMKSEPIDADDALQTYLLTI